MKEIDHFCYNLPLLEYWGLLQTIASNREGEMREKIESKWEGRETKGIAFVLTGSDGKRERHPQSSTEMIVLLDESFDRRSNLEGLEDDWFLGEVKEVGKEVLSFYKGDVRFVYPDRILGGLFLFGDEGLWLKVRKNVVKEMVAEGELGRKIRDQIKEQTRVYRRTLETGIYRGLEVFDSGRQFYFESKDWKNNRMGFKMGPIRAVQRRMDWWVVQLIRNQKLEVEEVVKSFPSNTVERIRFFEDKKFMNNNMARSLTEAYLWFLREYHKVQEVFKNSAKDKVVEVGFNFAEFAFQKQRVFDFLNYSQELVSGFCR